MVKRYPIKSKNTIAHIRKATQGRILLENCHPFMRELWGRHWIFAHNGDLKGHAPELTCVYQPVGTTETASSRSVRSCKACAARFPARSRRSKDRIKNGASLQKRRPSWCSRKAQCRIFARKSFARSDFGFAKNASF